MATPGERPRGGEDRFREARTTPSEAMSRISYHLYPLFAVLVIVLTHVLGAAAMSYVSAVDCAGTAPEHVCLKGD